MPVFQSDFGLPNPMQYDYMNNVDSSLFTMSTPEVTPISHMLDEVAITSPSLFQVAGYETMDRWNNTPYITPGAESLSQHYVAPWHDGGLSNLGNLSSFQSF